jgi:transglutaminase-like putative cysteine protease
VGKSHGVKMKATDDQIAKSLESTTSYPCKHPKVTALAKKAIGDARTDREKVDRLVKFVYKFIRPSFGGKGMVVLDLLEKKKGDCTAYAALFTTLARSAGIPAREVSGFAYMGDSQKSFGGHAWNEVVIDGHWHPIDASTGAIEPDAARICLGSDQDGGLNFLKNFGSLTVRLIDVQPSN